MKHTLANDIILTKPHTKNYYIQKNKYVQKLKQQYL